MNTQSNSVPESEYDSQRIAPSAMAPTRPLYWSIRREMWENRSIYFAPLAAACAYIFGFLISLRWLSTNVSAMAELDPEHQRMELAHPYAHAGMLLMLTAFLVAFFYSLDALHGERRDRSILFWKSLPVSDLTTVLSKASIPLFILPMLAFVITVFLQIFARLLSNAVLLASGQRAGIAMAPSLVEMALVLLYGLIVITLWHAPIYCWLLLVSGWAKRATFLWAVFPPLALCVIEYLAFQTTYLSSLVKDRFFGFAAAAFDLTDKSGMPVDAHYIPLSQLALGRFLSNPELWIGLIFAAIFLAAAVRLRRYQGPI